MKKVSKTLSLVALCVVMIIMSVVPAFAATNDVTYVENHSKVDCANYYIDGANYRFLVKIPKGTPLSAITVKNVYTGETQKLSEMNTSTELGEHFTGITYMYTDSTSDCYTLSYYIWPGCPKYMWYEYGIKLYYDYNSEHYMATNTANGSTTEGPGYILKNY